MPEDRRQLSRGGVEGRTKRLTEEITVRFSRVGSRQDSRVLQSPCVQTLSRALCLGTLHPLSFPTQHTAYILSRWRNFGTMLPGPAAFPQSSSQPDVILVNPLVLGWAVGFWGSWGLPGLWSHPWPPALVASAWHGDAGRSAAAPQSSRHCLLVVVSPP